MIFEIWHPYFFLQDDNRDYFLPEYVANFRALLQGEIPLFNFHQFCGTPLLSSAQSAPFYPLNYVALALSKFFWGHYFAALDIIAILHLMIGAVGFYYFMSAWDLKKASCFFGGLTWVFCGFVVSVGDSWIPILGFAAYLPWNFFFLLKLLQRFSIRDFIALIVFKSLLFLLGWPQYFLYSITYECLFVFMLLAISSRYHEDNGFSVNPFDYVKYYFLHYVCVVSLILPVLLPVINHINISNRSNHFYWEEFSSFSYDIRDWFYGIFDPFSAAINNNVWMNQNYISHITYLAIIFAIVAVVFVKHPKYKYVLLFIVLGLIPFLFASDILLTRIVFYLPVFNKFRWPFKAAFFTSYSLIVIATFGFDSFWSKVKSFKVMTSAKSILLFTVLIAFQIGNIYTYYSVKPQRMFGIHLDVVPLQQPVNDRVRDGRIITIGPEFFREVNSQTLYGCTVPFMGFNYATLFGLYHFSGYEPLLLERNRIVSLDLNYKANLELSPDFSAADQQKLVAYFRFWGVRWYIVDKNFSYAFLRQFVSYSSDSTRNIYCDTLSKPIIGWKDDGVECKPLRYVFTTNTITVQTEKASAGDLVVNVVYNKYFRAFIDGTPVPILETHGSQMSVAVPKGSHCIVIKYSDPYFTFGVWGTATFLLASLGFLCTRQYTLLKKKK